jgi:PAS domain S-box-containing protein
LGVIETVGVRGAAGVWLILSAAVFLGACGGPPVPVDRQLAVWPTERAISLRGSIVAYPETSDPVANARLLQAGDPGDLEGITLRLPSPHRRKYRAEAGRVYVYRFETGVIPARAALYFHGVHEAAEVYLNGELVGGRTSLFEADGEVVPIGRGILVQLPPEVSAGRSSNLIALRVVSRHGMGIVDEGVLLGPVDDVELKAGGSLAGVLIVVTLALLIGVMQVVVGPRRRESFDSLSLGASCACWIVWIVTHSNIWFLFHPGPHWKDAIARLSTAWSPAAAMIFGAAFVLGRVPTSVKPVAGVSLMLGLVAVFPGVPAEKAGLLATAGVLWSMVVVAVFFALAFHGLRQRIAGSRMLLATTVVSAPFFAHGGLVDMGLVVGPSQGHFGVLLMVVGFAVGLELKHQAERAGSRELLQSADDLIVATDSNGRIVVANDAAAAMLGFRRSWLIGKQLAQVLEPDELQPMAQFLENLKTERSARREIELSRKGGGLARVVDLRASRLPGEGTLLVGRDLSEYRALSERLLRRSQLESLGMLSAGIAHDFNNVLGAIELGLDRPDLDDERFDIVRSAAHRGRALVSRLLSATGGDMPRFVRVNLEQLLQRLGPSLRDGLSDEVTLELNVDPGVPSIDADPLQLEQLLSNLILNARDAMPSGGRIVLNVSHSQEGPGGSSLILEVSDSGPGIDKAMAARVFEPFFTSKTPGKGMGLGLAMVDGIVRAHGGTIEMHSEPGSGSTFRIVLPARRLAGTTTTSGFLPSISDERPVLVVEDNAEMAKLLVDGLTRRGYPVVGVSRPSKALKFMDGRAPCAVVVDLSMPEMDGLELLVRLRQNLPDLPAVVMSGYAQEAVLQRVEALPHTTFVAKPFRFHELELALERVML